MLDTFVSGFVQYRAKSASSVVRHAKTLGQLRIRDCALTIDRRFRDDLDGFKSPLSS